VSTLVLASQSPARLATLRAAGVEPVVVVSGVDEDQLGPLPPAELALQLAELKCAAVAAREDLPSAALVLGCDSVLELDGEALGKPLSADEATRRCSRFSKNERKVSRTSLEVQDLVVIGGVAFLPDRLEDGTRSEPAPNEVVEEFLRPRLPRQTGGKGARLSLEQPFQRRLLVLGVDVAERRLGIGPRHALRGELGSNSPAPLPSGGERTRDRPCGSRVVDEPSRGEGVENRVDLRPFEALS